MAFRRRFETFLEVLVLGLLGTLALVVVLGVVFRKAGGALVWYDEVASILLAWLTYYGACLAALHRAHIGFPTVVEKLGRPWRTAVLLVREVVVIGFFVVAAWAGWRVLAVLEGTYLVSLPWMPARVTQSVIPLGSVLFIVAELLALPEVLRGAPATDAISAPAVDAGPTPEGDEPAAADADRATAPAADERNGGDSGGPGP